MFREHCVDVSSFSFRGYARRTHALLSKPESQELVLYDRATGLHEPKLKPVLFGLRTLLLPSFLRTAEGRAAVVQANALLVVRQRLAFCGALPLDPPASHCADYTSYFLLSCRKHARGYHSHVLKYSCCGLYNVITLHCRIM